MAGTGSSYSRRRGAPFGLGLDRNRYSCRRGNDVAFVAMQSRQARLMPERPTGRSTPSAVIPDLIRDPVPGDLRLRSAPHRRRAYWIPAFAGMTAENVGWAALGHPVSDVIVRPLSVTPLTLTCPTAQKSARAADTPPRPQPARSPMCGSNPCAARRSG
jgi:hypothetical protein